MRAQAGGACNAVQAVAFARFEQVVVQIALIRDPGAFCPGLLPHRGLPPLLLRPLVQRRLEPRGGSARPDLKAAAHRPHAELPAMPGHERLSRFASCRNTRSPFRDVALLRHPQQLALQTPDLRILLRTARGSLRDVLLPSTEEILADPEPLRNVADRATPPRDLRDPISAEIVAELVAALHGLLASKRARKASTKNGVIHSRHRTATHPTGAPTPSSSPRVRCRYDAPAISAAASRNAGRNSLPSPEAGRAVPGRRFRNRQPRPAPRRSRHGATRRGKTPGRRDGLPSRGRRS